MSKKSNLEIVNVIPAAFGNKSVAVVDDKKKPSSNELVLTNLAKVAVGILAWPIAQLSKPQRFKKHFVRKVMTDGEKAIAIEWAVTPHAELGMPTMLSLRLLFAFCKLAGEYKMQTGSFPKWLPLPSWNQLCQIIGIEPARHNRELLQHHLKVLHFTLVSSKSAFRTDNKKTEGISDNFVLVPSIRFKGEKSDGVVNEQTYIALAKPIMDSLEGGYVKTIDLAFMAQLDNETAQLLYTKVSYLLYQALQEGREYEDFEYAWLTERMGLTVWQRKYQAKEQLVPAFRALTKSQYIQEPEWWIDGSWRIRLRPGVRFEFGEHLQLEMRKAAVRRKSAKKAVLPEITTKESAPTQEEIRQAFLARMAIRLNLGMDVDLTGLETHGFALDDVKAKAIEVKNSERK